MTKLTEHFSLEELIRSDKAKSLNIENVPSDKEKANLKRLCEVLEKVRTVLGNKPINISSGFRNTEVNRAVGGVWNSAHLTGEAADFTCSSFGTVKEVAEAIAPHVEEFGIDQLIHEYSNWIHLGISKEPRHAVFTLNSSGYHKGIV